MGAGGVVFTVSQLSPLTNKGRANGDTNPLTHGPHFPWHITGTERGWTFVPWQVIATSVQ